MVRNTQHVSTPLGVEVVVVVDFAPARDGGQDPVTGIERRPAYRVPPFDPGDGVLTGDRLIETRRKSANRSE